MTVLPLDPWVLKTRKVLLWVGFGWPIIVILASGLIAPRGGADWVISGVLFLTPLLAPIAAALSLVLPTYKSRIIVVPPITFFLFFVVSGFRAIPYLLLGVISLTAVGLVVPQWSSMIAFFRRHFDR